MNNKSNVVGQVLLTSNFKQFKKMPGNRAVSPATVKRLVESFNTVGYIPTPIICNEGLQVIDGQNRLEACKQTNTPIAYLVIPGIGGAECISMNANGTKWKLMDYIDYYAEQGNVSYVLLKDFLTVNADLPLSCALWTLSQTVVTNQKSEIVLGEYALTKEQVEFSQGIADYMRKFSDIPSNKLYILMMALGVCYMLPDVDLELLDKKVHQNPNKFDGLVSIVGAMAALETVYNFRKKGSHVYLETLYYQRLENVNKGIKNAVMSNVRKARSKANLFNEVENNG